MIRIEVTACEGQPPDQPLVAEFDERGGTIGRAEGNTLVLPDPKRYISRTHASVIFRAGSFVVRDVGSASPVIVNGKQLGAVREAPLRDGDVVSIANYTMRVVGEHSKTRSTGAAPVPPIGASAPAKDDPLAVFGAQTSESNPFADLMSAPGVPAGRDAPTPRQRVEDAPQDVERRPKPIRETSPTQRSTDADSAIIPEDFDPFAEPTAESTPIAENARENIDFGPATRDQNIDDIFGLAPTGTDGPLTPGSPLGEPRDESGGSPLDPLVAIGAARAKKREMNPAQRDDTPEIYGSFRLPPIRADRGLPVEPGGAGRWPGESKAAGAINGETPDSGRALAGSPRSIDAVPAPAGPVVAAAPAAPSAAATASAAGGSAESIELLREFLAGAGIPNVQVPGGLTPRLMNVLGHLFRESTRGTLDLLLARTTTKRELHSPVTTIVPRENNPLKFSPSVEAAMTRLLAPHDEGFMSPEHALRDAFDDLRAHEFGFMAGMRAALAGALARFDPSRLERRLAQNSMLDALLPMNRQAKLWALFGELYAEISREAEDNFHNLFGAEFLKAYEEQVAKLDQEQRDTKG